MNLHLSLLFLSCVFAGSLGRRHDQPKLNDESRITERKQNLPHNTKGTTPSHFLSDQRVPRVPVSRRKLIKNLLKEENKLKRKLKEISDQRIHVQKKIQREQRKLKRLQTQQRRRIKTTPGLQKWEAKDKNLIARENLLRGKILAVQKKYCSDCSTTTKQTGSMDTTTPFILGSVPTKSSSQITTEPGNMTRTIKPSNKNRAKGRKAETTTKGKPSTFRTSSVKTVSMTTVTPLTTLPPSILPISRRIFPRRTTTTAIPVVEWKTTTSMQLKTNLGVTPTTSTIPLVVTTYIKPTPIFTIIMSWKYKSNTTPATLGHSIAASKDKSTLEQSDYKLSTTPATLEHSIAASTEKEEVSIKVNFEQSDYKLSTTPPPVEHSIAASTEKEEVSTKSTLEQSHYFHPTGSTAATTDNILTMKASVETSEHYTSETTANEMATTDFNNQYVTTKPDHQEFFSVATDTEEVSSTKTMDVAPSQQQTRVSVSVLPSLITTEMMPFLKANRPTSKPTFYTPTRGSNTDSRDVKAVNKISNKKGQSVSSVVDYPSKTENQLMVMYLGVAVSVVWVLIVIISVAVYMVVIKGRCGSKTKDEEISMDSKTQEE